ncbi:hypothetical protein QYE76_057233 [Lolium multiflorum]|uniref:Retrotransposon gag domain-containing protein n=1 Tax=Lolium multiflorum TaxID=4521 RepID=A0AAD8T488_LOLMU|nr:hypothetical protein QYE76_057233 [Lolium multiflorum]
MMPKRKTIGYTKPYPNEYELIPLPPKYRLPDFTKFSGSDGSSSIEHVSRYLAQLGMISASDELRVRYFSQSLTGSAFGWYTSLPPNSVQTWKQLEERFHEQYHSEASEAGIADLAQVRQKRGETVSEYIQRFRTVRNRCYSVHVSEKEAVELAVVGLSSSIKDVASQADYPSLAHMVQKLSAYEQRHPDVYQDKFKRVVTMVDAGEDEGATGEQEVAVAEWTRAAGPVTCKWVKPPGPPRGFDFDVTKTEQIFDLLLAEKHIKVPEGHKVPTVQELNGKPYCKWHNTFTHTTNDCRVWRQQIQMAIENGRLIFNQYAMKVDTHPFPAVNMVEFAHLGGCQPDFSANISMVELGHRSEKDGDEDSCSQSKDTEGAAPCDRLRQDGKRYVTEGEVKNIRYQRPLSDHLLNKYVGTSRFRAEAMGNENSAPPAAGAWPDLQHKKRNATAELGRDRPGTETLGPLLKRKIKTAADQAASMLMPPPSSKCLYKHKATHQLGGDLLMNMAETAAPLLKWMQNGANEAAVRTMVPAPSSENLYKHEAMGQLGGDLLMNLDETSVPLLKWIKNDPDEAAVKTMVLPPSSENLLKHKATGQLGGTLFSKQTETAKPSLVKRIATAADEASAEAATKLLSAPPSGCLYKLKSKDQPGRNHPRVRKLPKSISKDLNAGRRGKISLVMESEGLTVEGRYSVSPTDGRLAVTSRWKKFIDGAKLRIGSKLKVKIFRCRCDMLVIKFAVV